MADEQPVFVRMCDKHKQGKRKRNSFFTLVSVPPITITHLHKPLLMFIAQVGTGATEEYLREELDLSLPVVPTLQPGNQTRAIRISTALLRITESSSKRF